MIAYSGRTAARTWRALLLFGLLGALISACGQAPTTATTGDDTPPPPTEPIVLEAFTLLTDFQMPSTTGRDLRLSDFQGSYAVLFFGYTHCPDFCPTTLGEYKQVKQRLGDAVDHVQFVFISVDGERDTPEALAKYVSIFDPAFVGLSGTDATLQPIAKQYGLYYKLRKEEAVDGNYFVDHTTLSYLVDPQGQLVAMYPYGLDPQIIADDLRARVAQQPS